jgi:hypothetical protein
MMMSTALASRGERICSLSEGMKTSDFSDVDCEEKKYVPPPGKLQYLNFAMK